MKRFGFVSAALLVLWFVGCSSSDEGGADLPGMTAARHDALFPISTAPHNEPCAACHGTGDSFAQMSCIDCHRHTRQLSDTGHVGIVAGYQYAPRTCYACHPRGEAQGFDHEAQFPIAAGTTHQNLRCANCHVDPNDRTQLDCVSCHTREKTDPRHAAVGEYQWNSRACYQCHPQSNVPMPVDHDARFPISAGTKHQGIGCATCHVDPTNRKVFDCVSCHTHEKTVTDANHQVVAAYVYSSPNCYACHPQANVTSAVNHTFFPIAAGDKHQNLSCASCHPVAGDKKQFDCVSCHTHEKATTDANHQGVPNYAYASADCLACHPDSNVVGLIDHTAYFPIAAGTTHAGTSCSKCHTVPGDKKIATCAECHTSAKTLPQHSQVGGYAFSAPLCLKCHGEGQVDRVAQHLPFGITPIFEAHFREDCLKCHPSPRTDKWWAQDFTLPKVSCAACHSKSDMDDKHAGRTGYSYTTSSCLQSGCHPDGTK